MVVILATIPVPVSAFDITALPVAGAPDPAKLEPLAEQGDVTAQVAFARALERGEGLPPNLRRARQYYCRAARSGHSGAAFRLGRMFMMGWGVPVDIRLSMAWTREAARRGSVEARDIVRFMPKAAPLIQLSCEPRRPGEGARYLPSSRRNGGGTHAHTPPAQILALVRGMAPRYGLDPELVLAVIEAESGFDGRSISNKNAQGLMQLIPDTAARFGVEDPFDPEDNLRGGMSYLRWLLAYFEGDVRLTLAGYNAGEGAVNRHGNTVPPFSETRTYVDRILRRYPHSRHPYDSGVTTPSSKRRSRLAKAD
ncbi:MAG: transglycosylase SLT domain-containing protein [Rhodospirillaceae bacterium]